MVAIERPQLRAHTFKNNNGLIGYLTDTTYALGSQDATCQSFFTHKLTKAVRFDLVNEMGRYAQACIFLKIDTSCIGQLAYLVLSETKYGQIPVFFGILSLI